MEIKSVRTVIDYCDFLQESYLIELIPRFSYSIHQQQANPKKAYAIDTAMAKANQEDQLDGIPLIPAWKWMGNIY